MPKAWNSQTPQKSKSKSSRRTSERERDADCVVHSGSFQHLDLLSLSLLYETLIYLHPRASFCDEQHTSFLLRRTDRRVSQVADMLPVVSPDIVVREARLEDCWEVAETHCSSFFPNYSFPLDIILRVDRLVGMLSGFTLLNGCKRTCLVAVIGSSSDDIFCFGNEDMKIGGFDGKFSLNWGYVAGILTVDTVADFLPRKGPLRQRRKGIACVERGS